jgi:hypothetical protein
MVIFAGSLSGRSSEKHKNAAKAVKSLDFRQGELKDGRPFALIFTLSGCDTPLFERFLS